MSNITHTFKLRKLKTNTSPFSERVGGVRFERVLLCLLLFLLPIPTQAATLPSLLSALETRTLQSDFTLSVTDEQSQPVTYAGTLTMQADRFILSMWSIEAAYDGTTLYMYNDDTEELTLSTPTDEELRQTNPFLYAQALVPVCQVEEKELLNKGQTLITLTPNDTSAGIARFTLRVNTTTLLPLSVEIRETTGKTTTLRLTNPTYLTTTPTFTITKPDAFLNDIR